MITQQQETECRRCKEREEQRNEQKRIRKAQKQILNGEEGPYDRVDLIRKGQVESVPYVLDDDRPETIAVVKDDITDHWNVGANGVKTEIVKGECKRCGCNRLKVSRLEPAGEEYIACVACKARTTGDVNFDYEIARRD